MRQVENAGIRVRGYAGMTSDCTVGGLCEIFIRGLINVEYMKFLALGWCFPGVAFHLAQPLCLLIRHVFLMISQEVYEITMGLYTHCLI